MCIDQENKLSPDEQNDTASDQGKAVDYEFTNSVSLPSLVKLLVLKGIVTVDELITAEREFRHYSGNCNDDQKTDLVRKKRRYKRGILRRFAVRHRWSRRLTTRLFGWHWKKVAVNSDLHNEDEH